MKDLYWILGLPPIIFSSAIYHPLINITPRHLRASVLPYLASNQYGAGHYDGVTLSSTSSRSHAVTSSIQSAQCSCGKNDKSGKTHCQPQVMKYTSVTRCQCYKEQNACTSFCKCKQFDDSSLSCLDNLDQETRTLSTQKQTPPDDHNNTSSRHTKVERLKCWSYD